jgi:hypothetical protein
LAASAEPNGAQTYSRQAREHGTGALVIEQRLASKRRRLPSPIRRPLKTLIARRATTKRDATHRP